MIRFIDLIKPNSGKSSTRYAGLVSLYVLIVMAAVVLAFSWFGKEIPRNNADLMQSIAYTLGVVVAGAFIKMGLEKRENKTEIKIDEQ
ncbi:MAG: hypothetical protein ACMV0Y_02450 [Paludibacter sp.]